MRKDTFTIGTGKVLKFKPINIKLLENNYYFKKQENPEKVTVDESNQWWIFKYDYIFKFLV